jgi:hypothetical protein
MPAKKLQRFTTFFAAFAMTASITSAASISISDLRDGNPNVMISSDLHFTSPPVFSPGLVSIFVVLPDSNMPTVAVGRRSVILTDPSSNVNGPTHFVNFAAAAVGQFMSVLFESDTAPTFEQDVHALGNNVPTLVEDGSLQDLSGPQLLNTSPALTITVQLAPPPAPTEIPEPGTRLLLAAGLLGYIASGRLNKVLTSLGAVEWSGTLRAQAPRLCRASLLGAKDRTQGGQ